MEVSLVMGDRLGTLRYWGLVEALSVQRVPEPLPSTGEVQIVEWSTGLPLPWETLSSVDEGGAANRLWRHIVYLGVYELKASYERLQREFGEEAGSQEPPCGWGACGGFAVDQHGFIVEDSAVLSRALWANGRINAAHLADLKWGDGWSEAQQRFTDAVEHVREAAKVALRPGTLLDLQEAAHDAAGVSAWTLRKNRIVIESVLAEPRCASVAINSEFLPGLEKLNQEAAKGNLGPALNTYLAANSRTPVDRRVDVVLDRAAVHDGVRASAMPEGRWLNDPKEPRALREQYAINQAASLAEGAGVVGVHAAPGTGSVEVVRDLVAANMVERARRLASLERPEEAFTGTVEWEAEGFLRRVRLLRPELTGFEMVVASTNEAAVDRVATDLASPEGIAESWRADEGYLGAAAGKDAWAVLSARLGNQARCIQFARDYWSNNGLNQGQASLKSLLEAWRDGAPRRPWDVAQAEFRAAERRVDLVLGERRRAEARVDELAYLIAQEGHLSKLADEELQAAQLAERQFEAFQPVVADAAAEMARRNTRYEEQMSLKPGAFEAVLSFGTLGRKWHAAMAAATDAVDAAAVAQQEIEEQDRQLREAVGRHRANLAQVEADLHDVGQKLARLRQQVAADHARFKELYPSMDLAEPLWEIRTPWLDAELDAARSKLFRSALRLHEDFIAYNARDMLYGLSAAVDVMTGSNLDEVSAEKQLAAWQLLFLVVPVVATTLAEIGPMLGATGREAIGWLILDEAGQVPAQRAADAFWRARRVLCIGDPMRLAPDSPLPNGASQALARMCQAPSAVASAQSLVDHSARQGTTLPKGLWVSPPLRVHRGSDNPMFTLCNEVGYGGLLINAVRRTLDDPRHPDLFDSPTAPRILSSRWADLPAPTPGSHLQPNQVGMARGLLARLGDSGVGMEDIVVVSPFQEMGERLAGLSSDFPGLQGGAMDIAQGREAKVVVLVLGGDPERPEAKAVLPSSAMVTVAAGCAQRRLYVIGDRAAWRRHGAFGDLADALEIDS